MERRSTREGDYVRHPDSRAPAVRVEKWTMPDGKVYLQVFGEAGYLGSLYPDDNVIAHRLAKALTKDGRWTPAEVAGVPPTR